MASEEVVSDQANHFSIVDHNQSHPSEMRPPSPSIPEKEFVVEALKQGLRLDGRAALEMRQPTLTFGPDLGWVDCSLGKTRHEFLRVCLPRKRLTLELKSARPGGGEDGQAAARTTVRRTDNDSLRDITHGFERIRARSVGIFSIQRVNRSEPLCNYSPSEEEVTITRMLDKIIRRSDVVDKESLCIQSGQRVRQLLVHRRVSHRTEMGVGVELAAHDSLPGGFRKYAGLCMLSGDGRTEAFPTTRGGGCW
jgi:hypothetical protein